MDDTIARFYDLKKKAIYFYDKQLQRGKYFGLFFIK